MHNHEEHHHHEDATGEPNDLAVCPVMGVTVNKHEAEAKGLVRSHNGQTYYLCCNTCAGLFDADPDKYASKETSAHEHVHEHDHNSHSMSDNINKTAASATLHCLTGCAIGEVLGMVISTALHWSTGPSIAISVILAFFFGYSLTIRPLLKAGLGIRKSLKLAFASDTASISVMELADNAFILAVPGAIHAGLNTALFWISLAVSLVVAFAFAFPLNRFLIGRGKGHAVIHEYHH